MRKYGTLMVIFLAMAGCMGEAAHPMLPGIQSGLQVGDDIVPWNPIHVAGPDKGTNACPICTYEARPAIQIFIKDGPNVAAMAQRLQKLVEQQQKYDLKGFIIVLDANPAQLTQLGNDLKIQKIGLCYPDPQSRVQDLKAYKINPSANTTVVIYKNYKVTANWVDLSPNDFEKIESAVNALH